MLDETIGDTEYERYLRGPHIGQSIFWEQTEEYRSWYLDYVQNHPELTPPQR